MKFGLARVEPNNGSKWAGGRAQNGIKVIILIKQMKILVR